MRLLWTAGREGGGEPTGLVLVSTLPPGLDELARARPAPRRRASGPQARSPGAKSTSYAENMAAQGDAAERGADDALLVAPDGTVLEAPTSNVWFREAIALLTPSLALPLLAGVTRAALQRLAPAAGYEVEEGTFPLDRLLARGRGLSHVLGPGGRAGGLDRRLARGRWRTGPGSGGTAARSAGGRGLP